MQTLTLFSAGTLILGVNYGNHPEAVGVFCIDDETAAAITPESTGEIKKGKLYIDGSVVKTEEFVEEVIEETSPIASVDPVVELTKEEIEQADKSHRMAVIKEEIRELLIQRETNEILGEDNATINKTIDFLKEEYQGIVGNP